MVNGHVTEVASLMEGELPCYSLMERQWSCYREGHFNRGRMVIYGSGHFNGEVASLKKGEWLL